LLFSGGDGRLHGDWPVAGENAFVQEVVRLALDRKLEVAVLKSVGDSLVECGHQVVGRPDDSEKAVAAM
jgi:hypothetical protein